MAQSMIDKHEIENDKLIKVPNLESDDTKI